MATALDETKTASVMRQVEAAVVEERQIVSFKWIAREFGLNARQARRLLEEFASGKFKEKISRVHLLSGWTKTPKPAHTVQLVPEEKLSEVEGGLEKVSGRSLPPETRPPPPPLDALSAQLGLTLPFLSLSQVTSKYIYSIQPCVLKDTGALWSAEYVQIDALYSEPTDVKNTLRENGLSNITCKEVHRKEASQAVSGPAQSRAKAKSEPVPEKSRKAPAASGGGSALGSGKAKTSGGGISLTSPPPKKKMEAIFGAGGSAKPAGISLNTPKKSAGISLNAPKREAKKPKAAKKSPPPAAIAAVKEEEPSPVKAGGRRGVLEESSDEEDSFMEEEPRVEPEDMMEVDEAPEPPKVEEEEGKKKERKPQLFLGGGDKRSGAGVSLGKHECLSIPRSLSYFLRPAGGADAPTFSFVSHPQGLPVGKRRS